MNSLKYWIFSFAVFLLLIICAAIYRFNFTNDDIYVVTQDGSIVAHDSTQHHMANLLPLGEKIEGDLLVSLPESDSDIQVALTSFSHNGKLELASGKYSDGEAHGDVMLDYHRIFPLQFPGEDGVTSFVAPFAVTTQGSGVFWYLGLFCQDHHTGKIRHLASEFIGDRIKVNKISVVKPFVETNKIRLSYRDRSDAIAMSQEPDIQRVRNFKVSTANLQPLTGAY